MDIFTGSGPSTPISELFASAVDIQDASDALELMPEVAARWATVLREEEGGTFLAGLETDNRDELRAILEAMLAYVVTR